MSELNKIEGLSEVSNHAEVAALAGELQLPLLTVLYDSLITKFMGETASQLRLIFDAMSATRGIYFFDEFDVIGSQRGNSNGVGEIRRVLRSCLQFLENDRSSNLIIAATITSKALLAPIHTLVLAAADRRFLLSAIVSTTLTISLLAFKVYYKKQSNRARAVARI